MYDDTITVDKAYYNKLKEQTTWVSFKDRLPEIHQRTLIYSKCLGYICGRKFQNGYLIPDDSCSFLPMSINYLIDIGACWLPCPEPPDLKERKQ